MYIPSDPKSNTFEKLSKSELDVILTDLLTENSPLTEISDVQIVEIKHYLTEN